MRWSLSAVTLAVTLASCGEEVPQVRLASDRSDGAALFFAELKVAEMIEHHGLVYYPRRVGVAGAEEIDHNTWKAQSVIEVSDKNHKSYRVPFSAIIVWTGEDWEFERLEMEGKVFDAEYFTD